MSIGTIALNKLRTKFERQISLEFKLPIYRRRIKINLNILIDKFKLNN